MEIKNICFDTLCGDIFVDVNDDFYIINFPSYSLNEINVTDEMTKAIGVKPVAAYIDRDLMLIVESESELRNLKINQEVLKKSGRTCNCGNSKIFA